jgi:Ca-activated chloride channel family protein
MLENFHFIQPLWLLALLPLALLAWRLYRPGDADNPWVHVVDARLLPLLMFGRETGKDRSMLALLSAGWVIAVLALANPAWERKPEPVYQTSASRVIVLDLSQSMNAADLKPSRLARARYKIEDVLALSTEGQSGLVVYAGDAFTVSPLTRDANTIRALLPALDPGIMPSPGSRADLGLLKAAELLRHAGATSGQVLLITDGVEAGNLVATESVAARLKADGYSVSVIGAGTEAGVPLTSTQDKIGPHASDGQATSSFSRERLLSVAHAGGGNYQSLADNSGDLNALLSDVQPLRADVAVNHDAATQRWKEQGPLLALLLLPLGALAFRRNWLVGVLLVAGMASPPQTAMAATWSDMWQRPDQQAAKALAAGDYAKAAQLAPDARQRGSAEYKRGNFEIALDNFSHATGTDADYNRGNALARLSRYPDAIAAYDKALKEDPANDDAKANKAAVEALLKKQQQAQQQNPQNDSAQKKQDQSKGGGKSTSSGQSQDQSSKDGKNGQSGTSSGQQQQAAGAQQPKGGSAKNDTSPVQGKAGAQQPGNAASGKAGTEQNANSGKPGSQPEQSASGKAQQGEAQQGKAQQGEAQQGKAQQGEAPNQFAEAAKKLAGQPAGSAKASPGNSPLSAAAGDDSAQSPGNAGKHAPNEASGHATPLQSEEQMAAEQWLRRIPDDPGGLLRRKFLYQYRQRGQQASAADAQLL